MNMIVGSAWQKSMTAKGEVPEVWVNCGGSIGRLAWIL